MPHFAQLKVNLSQSDAVRLFNDGQDCIQSAQCCLQSVQSRKALVAVRLALPSDEWRKKGKKRVKTVV